MNMNEDKLRDLENQIKHALTANRLVLEEEVQRLFAKFVAEGGTTLSKAAGHTTLYGSHDKAIPTHSEASQRSACTSEWPVSGSEFKAVQLQNTIGDIKEYVHEHNRTYTYIKLCGRFGKVLAWFSGIKEPPRLGCLAQLVTSKRFELFTLIVIILNSAQTIVDTNWQMKHLDLKRPGLMIASDAFFTAFYASELVLRLLVHRLYFFWNGDAAWNCFDSLLVGLSLADAAFIHIRSESGGFINPGFIRLIRILKLVKILRFFRVLHFVSELRLMMQCVLGSLSSLMWSFILLGLITLVFAIVFVQQLSLFVIEDASRISDSDKHKIFAEFGSVQLALLSLFQGISGGQDWSEFYTTVNQAGPVISAVFIAYMLFIWLSVTNIITSLFVDKATRLAKPDLEDLLLEKRQEDVAQAAELTELFLSMDENRSGTITLDEFERSMKDIRITSFFDINGLSINHASLFFKLLASLNESHQIRLDTFVSGCLRMKGLATNIDVITLLYQTSLIADQMRAYFSESRNELKELLQDIRFSATTPDFENSMDQVSL